MAAVLVSSARTGQPHGRGFPRAPPARVSAPAPNPDRPSVRRAPQGTTASQTGQSPLAPPRAPATEVGKKGKGKTRRKPDWRKPRVPLFFSVLARSLESRTDRWMGSLLALGRKYSCGAHPPNPSRAGQPSDVVRSGPPRRPMHAMTATATYLSLIRSRRGARATCRQEIARWGVRDGSEPLACGGYRAGMGPRAPMSGAGFVPGQPGSTRGRGSWAAVPVRRRSGEGWGARAGQLARVLPVLTASCSACGGPGAWRLARSTAVVVVMTRAFRTTNINGEPQLTCSIPVFLGPHHLGHRRFSLGNLYLLLSSSIEFVFS